jgi:predicted nucleic acid-binding Zn ribbon protein
MDRKKFTEKFCKASMTVFMLIMALLIVFLVILTG